MTEGAIEGCVVAAEDVGHTGTPWTKRQRSWRVAYRRKGMKMRARVVDVRTREIGR